jgi:hypothetical protein
MTTLNVATLTLVAVDLARSEEHNLLWRKQKTAVRPSREFYPGLPRGGLATAVGYWFAETKDSLRPDAFRVDVMPPGDREAGAEPEAESAVTRGTPERRHFPTVIVPGGSYRGAACPPAAGFSLQVGPNWARVGVEAAEWPSISPPVLLTVSLCWRLMSIVEWLDEITEDLRDSHRSPGGPWSRAGFRRRELGRHLRAVRSVVVDLPCFEGPLLDPQGYFATRRAARLFRVLVDRLELERWQSVIDERIEVVEATFEALAEERRHLDSLTWEIVLEVLILVALVGDIGINVLATWPGS